MPLSDWGEENILNHWMRGAASGRQDEYVVALYVTATTDAGGGDTVPLADWTNYVPVTVDASAASSIFSAAEPEAGPGTGHQTANTAVIDFGTPVVPNDPVTVTHVALRTAAPGGGFHFMHGALAEPKIVTNGDPFTIPIGELVLALR